MQRPTGPLCDGCHSVNYDVRTRSTSPNGTSAASDVTAPVACTSATRKPHPIVNPATLDVVAPTTCASSVTRRDSLGTIPSKGAITTGPSATSPADAWPTVWELEEHHLGDDDVHALARRDGAQESHAGQRLRAEPDVRARACTCFACHDVHGTEHEADLRLPGNAVCLQCHGPQLQPGPRGTIEFHTQHSRDSEGSKCVACHMPADRADHCECERPQPHIQVHLAGHVGAVRRAESVHVVSQGQVHRMGDRGPADLAGRAPVAGCPVTT